MEHPSGIKINFILNASNDEPTNILMDIPQKYTGYLEITDLDAIQRQLADLNIAIIGDPITIPCGAQFIFVRDPDGNVIEFHLPVYVDK